MRDIIRALPDVKGNDDSAEKKKEGDGEEKENDGEEPPKEEEEEEKVAEEELPKEIQERLERLVKILDGRTTMELHLSFLCANNKTDLLILKKMKRFVSAQHCTTQRCCCCACLHEQWYDSAHVSQKQRAVAHKGHELGTFQCDWRYWCGTYNSSVQFERTIRAYNSSAKRENFFHILQIQRVSLTSSRIFFSYPQVL